MKNGIIAEICLVGMTVFSGCDNTEPDDATPTSVRLVSRINYDHQSIYEFFYDEQNCLTKITKVGNDDTITYLNANTIVMSPIDYKFQSPDTLSLNGEGAVVSITGNRTASLTYANGYLQNYELFAYDRHYTTIFTWENGNIKTMVEEVKYPDGDFLTSSTETRTYEYGTTQNKPCSIDLGLTFFIGDAPRGWYGKTVNYLPSEIKVKRERNFSDHRESYAYTELCSYETDSKGYVTKIFYDNKYNDDEDSSTIIDYQ